MSSELRVDKIIPTVGVPTGGGGSIIQIKQTVQNNTGVSMLLQQVKLLIGLGLDLP